MRSVFEVKPGRALPARKGNELLWILLLRGTSIQANLLPIGFIDTPCLEFQSEESATLRGEVA